VRLLRALTLGYLAVLVAALAASLIAILVELRRIGAGLGEVGAALTRARDRTAPLGGHLQTVQDASVALADRMQAARTSLGHADDALAEVARGDP
jgi:hypothetical protein